MTTKSSVKGLKLEKRRDFKDAPIQVRLAASVSLVLAIKSRCHQRGNISCMIQENVLIYIM